MGFFDFFKKSKKDGHEDNEDMGIESDIIDDLELKEIIDKKELEKDEGILEKFSKKIFSTEEELSLKEIEKGIKKEDTGEEDSQEENKEEEKYDHNEDNQENKEEKQNDKDSKEEDSEEEINETFDENEEEKKEGFFVKLTKGLLKTRDNIIAGIDDVFSAFTVIDEEMLEELEEVLILADIGVNTSLEIIDKIRQRAKKENKTKPEEAKAILIEEISKILSDEEAEKKLETPAVIMVIGVNGAGKTTTIAKLANIYKKENKSVLMAAGDTFRAAAIEQLEEWGKRTNVEVIRQMENSDPAAVIFDALKAAKSRNTDVLICDTAGRLHNKKNLMDELEKINRIVDREYAEAHRETYLVLDATAGQNAVQQAKLFSEVAEITGIVLTKLDGTAKGGVVIAIKSELDIPIKYIGVGEGIDDLQKFDANAFARALFQEK